VSMWAIKEKPFCDSTHVKVNFDGTEVSDNELFEKMAKEIDGPALHLKDAEILVHLPVSAIEEAISGSKFPFPMTPN